MRAHVIEDGKIINTIEAAGLDALPGVQLVDAALAGGAIGDYYDGKTGKAVPVAQPVDLEALKSAAIAKTYTDVDGVILAAVGNRAEEYKDAEGAARAFLEAGGDGDVDVAVSSYAQFNPTGEAQTNAWAAEQIIQRADAFRAAQKAMRAERFARQAEMRAAATEDDLASAVQVWETFIAGIVSGLGL